MKIVRVRCNGVMDDLVGDITPKNIKKKLKDLSIDRGKAGIQHLYTWEYDGTTILCYGWSNGSAGKENTHDLPPSGNKLTLTLDNSDTQLLFGDVFILRKEDTTLCDVDVAEYGLFYSLCFEGFDDCFSDTNESDSELDDIIVDSTDEDGSEDYCVSDELDEDTHEY